MTLHLENTTNWPAEKLLSYGPEITKAMKKLAEKFPREVTLMHLAKEVISGKRQLWLIMDGEEFKSFVVTEIQVHEATGKKTLIIPSLAGDEGLNAVPLIGKLEEWGRENGCDASAAYGRKGWAREMAKEGYSADMIVYRKTFEAV